MRHHHSRLPRFHVGEQTADEIRHQIGAQRPGRAEIAEDPDHVGNAREHQAAIGDAGSEIQRFAINLKRDVAEHAEVKPGGGDDDIRIQMRAGLQGDARLIEGFDMIGDHARRARRNGAEQIAIGDIGDALAPGAIGRGEMFLDVHAVTEVVAHAGQ